MDEFAYYPSQQAVEAWIDSVWAEAAALDLQVEEQIPEFSGLPFPRQMSRQKTIRFSSGADEFYAFWQPAASTPAPLLIHTPGYGAEISVHPELVAQGYNVLHINPFGYATPTGFNLAKLEGRPWPHWGVMAETLVSKAQRGYHQWFAQCIAAITWAQRQPEVLPDRVSFFGFSQGGGAALLLGSLYQGRGVRCVAAEAPFLTNIPLMNKLTPGGLFSTMLENTGNTSEAWAAVGYVDALSHVHRLTMPVLLTAGTADMACPAPAIETLFERLPTTKLYYRVDGLTHQYTEAFVALAGAWFRQYA